MDGTKLDAQSQADINKADKLLELNVRSGNLFFNVTESLETITAGQAALMRLENGEAQNFKLHSVFRIFR